MAERGERICWKLYPSSGSGSVPPQTEKCSDLILLSPVFSSIEVPVQVPLRLGCTAGMGLSAWPAFLAAAQGAAPQDLQAGCWLKCLDSHGLVLGSGRLEEDHGHAFCVAICITCNHCLHHKTLPSGFPPLWRQSWKAFRRGGSSSVLKTTTKEKRKIKKKDKPEKSKGIYWMWKNSMWTTPDASMRRWKMTGVTVQAGCLPARCGVGPRGALRARACWEVPFAGPAAALGCTGPLLPAEGPRLLGCPREV